MKRVALCGFLVVCLTSVFEWSLARTLSEQRLRPKIARSSSISLDTRNRGFQSSRAWSSANDTTILGCWDFNNGAVCDSDGWISVDRTVAAPGDFIHVDDFAGLDGGAFGGLQALVGTQSLWFGTRPSASDDELCSYASLPGYGNNWRQAFCTLQCLSVSGDVTMSYRAFWDTEPLYDYTIVEYDLCDGQWSDLDEEMNIYTGRGGGILSAIISDTLHSGNVRLRFRFFSDVAWSDEDGQWDTDGPLILDSLVVEDTSGVVVPLEDFESESVGATTTESGNWGNCNDFGYGDFAALFPAQLLVQEDACFTNISCVWGFFSGSTYNYACGGFGSQATVPYLNGRNQYISNEIWSPLIPWIGSGTRLELSFDVYRDLPLDALVFYVWHVRSFVGGCPGSWRDDLTAYHGSGNDWVRHTIEIGPLVESGATNIQVAVGVKDMCKFWCGSYGTGACHSHAPLFDNIEILRIDENGPQWLVNEWGMFQDNFASDGTVTGTVRADAAIDILPESNPGILPGDSAVVVVGDPVHGIGTDSYTGVGPAVYMYVSVKPQGQAGKLGSELSDDQVRFPVVDSLTHSGITWYKIRMDSVRVGGAALTFGVFCIDLNDNLFTPGDTVSFCFAATNAATTPSSSYWSQFIGTATNLLNALDNPMEFTCLPAAHIHGGEILYVDDFDGGGAQPYFESAFEFLGIDGKVDRYDVRSPTSVVGNGPASRISNIYSQILPHYKAIVWNSGTLRSGLIGDGAEVDKSNDYWLLYTFLDFLDNPGGVYLSGEGIARELSTLVSPDAVSFRTRFIDYQLDASDHIWYGLDVSPLVAGMAGSCFSDVTGPDTLIAYGGCPVINSFDVISPIGLNTTLEAEYRGMGVSGGAIVGQLTANFVDVNVGVLLSGFSFHQIRDFAPAGIPARVQHLERVLAWLSTLTQQPISVPEIPFRNSLSQNFPNPFNPTTMIVFTLQERSHVMLRIYNVAGQVVRTLVNEARAPGTRHEVFWNGLNDSGQLVSSGVYFYKLMSRSYAETKKMVLLK